MDELTTIVGSPKPPAAAMDTLPVKEELPPGLHAGWVRCPPSRGQCPPHGGAGDVGWAAGHVVVGLAAACNVKHKGARQAPLPQTHREDG